MGFPIVFGKKARFGRFFLGFLYGFCKVFLGLYTSTLQLPMLSGSFSIGNAYQTPQVVGGSRFGFPIVFGCFLLGCPMVSLGFWGFSF